MAVEKANISEKDSRDEKITFTFSGVLLGAKRTIPVAISVFAVGIVFGVLARQAKLSVVDVLLMSGLVFAGASQFVAISLWTAIPFPVATIIVTTFIINIRHMLMGASLRPWYAKLSSWKLYTTIFLMVDESWALTISDFQKADAMQDLARERLYSLSHMGHILCNWANNWSLDPEPCSMGS